MIPLAEAYTNLLTLLGSAPRLAIGLDYDGTITPIRPTPAEATPSDDALRLLMLLHRSPDVQLLLVTGRSPNDLAAMLGIPDIDIAGNHGLSWLNKGSLIHHRDARSFLRKRTELLDLLGKLAAGRPCVNIEDKGVGLAVHYRLCPPERQVAIKQELISHRRMLEERFDVKFTEGKKVVELRPATDVNKGSTFKVWLDSLCSEVGDVRPLPLYAGDDVTDQDVFRVADSEWVTIQVGRLGDGPCLAKYLASHHRELIEFLSAVIRNRSEAGEKGERN